MAEFPGLVDKCHQKKRKSVLSSKPANRSPGFTVVRSAQIVCSALNWGRWAGDLPGLRPGPEARPADWIGTNQNSGLLSSGEGSWVLGGTPTAQSKTRICYMSTNIIF